MTTMPPNKETFHGAIADRQFRSDLLNGVLSGEVAVILKYSHRCDPQTGRSGEVRTEFFSEKGLILWSIDFKPPGPGYGNGPQLSRQSDCQQMVLFESGELATVRTRHSGGENNVYTFGVGEYIEETTTDITPLTSAEFEKQRDRITEELWRRVCAIGKQ